MDKTFKVVYALLLLLPISSLIQTFEKNRFVSDGRNNGIIYDSMYSKSEFSEDNENPFISYNLKIETGQPNQLAFFVIGHRDHFLDGKDLHSDLFSCNIKEKEGKNERNENENYLKVPIDFKGTDSAQLIGTFKVVKSGLYSAVFVPCGNGITVTGQIRFKNPYGYASGHTYNYFKFYENVILVYIVIAIIWAIMVKNNWSYMYIHQHFISAIILTTILESIFNYFEYYHVNQEGEKSLILYILVVLFSVFRKTFTRLIVLLVSCGYGITEFKIKKLRLSFLQLLLAYYISFSLIREFLRYQSRFIYEKSSGIFTFLFYAVIYFMDLIFYLWTLIELKITLKSLKCKERFYQKLYEAFRVVLLCSFVTSNIFCYLEMSFTHFSILLPENWSYFWWYESGVWMIQYTIVLICTMHLWRPNKRLTYKKVNDIEDPTENDFKRRSSSLITDKDEMISRKKSEQKLKNGILNRSVFGKVYKVENVSEEIDLMDGKNEKDDKKQKGENDLPKDLLEKETDKKENVSGSEDK